MLTILVPMSTSETPSRGSVLSSSVSILPLGLMEPSCKNDGKVRKTEKLSPNQFPRNVITYERPLAALVIVGTSLVGGATASSLTEEGGEVGVVPIEGRPRRSSVERRPRAVAIARSFSEGIDSCRRERGHKKIEAVLMAINQSY